MFEEVDCGVFDVGVIGYVVVGFKVEDWKLFFEEFGDFRVD